MDHLINWCGFLGTWLLVAGPLAQGAKELSEEMIERDVLVRAARKVEAPPSVSPWWWVLPPVYYWKDRVQSNRYEEAIVAVMPEDQARSFRNFRDKANTWLAVSLGALLIAVNATWDLVQGYGWSQITFWLLIAFMTVIATGNTVFRARQRHQREEQENSSG